MTASSIFFVGNKNNAFRFEREIEKEGLGLSSCVNVCQLS